jgi:hypothetical protein
MLVNQLDSCGAIRSSASSSIIINHHHRPQHNDTPPGTPARQDEPALE